MNIKRSYLKLVMASAGVGLFLANCTVKTSSDDAGKTNGNGNGGEPSEDCTKGDKHSGCACPGNLVGYQVCSAEGVFGSCVCPDSSGTAGTGNTPEGGNANNGGTTYAGSDAGGVAAVNGGAGGEGGAPLTFDPLDCEDCLGKLCADELATCLDDVTCSDQYAAVIGCIDDQRGVDDGTTVVKRDVVRACGVTVGSSSTVQGFPDWAPIEMDPKTTDLLNCMATSSTDPQGPNPDWANDLDTNFPAAGPTPWPADSCAKLSCTSKF
jgi:hypothetical protein